MNRPRKQTYTNDMYLNKIKDGDIRNDSDTQRQFVWTNEQINELIVTVLTEDYIPPIILAEVDNSQLWIVDGGQRSASLNKFRYGDYKVTSAIENSIIPYKEKVRDSEGNIVWKDSSFDIKNKTYDKLPEELKKRFNEYQIETAIHEGCDSHRIAQLIKRYNNHTSMNTNQKAFTYIDNFAREIRDILDSKFFLNCGNYTEKERTKGVLERVVIEAIMCMFYFNDWKKQTKQAASYLNENATSADFGKFNDNAERLRYVIKDGFKELFNSKDSFIWFAIFHRFTELRLEDSLFADFLTEFENLKDKQVNGTTFNELDKNKGTKDKAVVGAKLDLITALMCEFFGVKSEGNDEDSVMEFLRENVNSEITREDLGFYTSILDDLTKNIKDKRLFASNKQSVIALIAYSCEADIDIDDWFEDYFDDISTFPENQTENYMNMKTDLDRYVRGVAV